MNTDAEGKDLKDGKDDKDTGRGAVVEERCRPWRGLENFRSP